MEAFCSFARLLSQPFLLHVAASDEKNKIKLKRSDMILNMQTEMSLTTTLKFVFQVIFPSVYKRPSQNT